MSADETEQDHVRRVPRLEATSQKVTYGSSEAVSG